MSLIISQIIGGLGNQMFQYAIGRAISLKHSTSLRLDISGFSNYGLHHGFELKRIFNCTADIASEADVRSILGYQFSSSIRRILLRQSMVAFRRKGFVVEPHFNYWQEIQNASSDSYLAGYWQSEKYFSKVAIQIRKDFSFSLPLEYQNSELSKQIEQVSAVSLHVRRGDYIHAPENMAKYEPCSLDYYKKSIRHVAERIKTPHFFIFSDDIAWVKNNLKMDFSHQYVDNNRGAESYNDMRIMSLCKHHIIANSTFSWWGAWLNSTSEKIVIAPKKWFSGDVNTSDLIPSEWVRI